MLTDCDLMKIKEQFCFIGSLEVAMFTIIPVETCYFRRQLPKRITRFFQRSPISILHTSRQFVHEWKWFSPYLNTFKEICHSTSALTQYIWHMLFLLELLTTSSPTTQHMHSSGTVKLNENYQFETISTVFDKYLESVCCVKRCTKRVWNSLCNEIPLYWFPQARTQYNTIANCCEVW